jgi:large subunit ribosomal protein L6
MSRLGKTPVSVPKGVKINVAGEQVTVEGPKGTLTKTFLKGFSVRIEGDLLFVDSDENITNPPAFYGLTRVLLCNMIIGVSKGFEKKLTLIGVGYRAAVQGQLIDLQLGFSHPMQLPIPKAVNVVIEKSTSITISGIDKQIVGQFAAEIRSKKPPEPYKGKGIRYENEYVRKKAGKAAKGKAG